MKRLKIQMLCAVCAIAVALSLLGIEWRGEDGVAFREALKGLSGEGYTRENFDFYYQDLNARNPYMGLWLCIMHPWLTWGESWGRIHGNTGGGGAQRSSAATRGPVTKLTITEFKVSATSFWFRVEWPLTLDIPNDELWFMSKLDLAQTWWDHLENVKVSHAKGYEEFEMLFDDFPSLYWEEMELSRKAFFMFRPSDPEEPWGGGWGDKDDEGDPPDIPEPFEWNQSELSFGRFLANYNTPVSHESIPVLPGRLYVVTLTCFDGQAISYDPLRSDNTYTWHITLPDGQVMSGSTDTQTMLGDIPPGGQYSDYAVQDVRVVYVPDPGPPPSGQQSAFSSSTPTVEAHTTVTPDTPGKPSHGLMRINGYVFNVSQHLLSTNAVGANPGTTDLGGFASQVIASNGVAFITGYPAAPSLEVRLLREGLSAEYRLEIEPERTNASRRIDARHYPTNGAYVAQTDWRDFDITDKLMKSEIVGGKCKLHYKITVNATGKKETGFFPFYIRGLNPPDAVAEMYINDHVDAVFTNFAWAIFRHETRYGAYIYNQFNAGGTYKHTANWGYPDGWGICMIDRSGDDPPGFTTTAEVYNWRTNVISGNLKLREKQRNLNSMLAKIERSYPKTWVEPPEELLFSNKLWKAKQGGITVLYNGAAGVKQTKVITNDTPEVWGRIRCPLVFDDKATATNRWSLSDNGSNYLYKVTREFDPNAFPKPKE